MKACFGPCRCVALSSGCVRSSNQIPSTPLSLKQVYRLHIYAPPHFMRCVYFFLPVQLHYKYVCLKYTSGFPAWRDDQQDQLAPRLRKQSCDLLQIHCCLPDSEPLYRPLCGLLKYSGMGNLSFFGSAFFNVRCFQAKVSHERERRHLNISLNSATQHCVRLCSRSQRIPASFNGRTVFNTCRVTGSVGPS